ncbi:protein trichome birefringence-like 3 [Phalaenopsis equestris]|uniref:protein trichome birefringence-like 3 n=1 Tax=Phalaenopsis equestris TaxID=78828 RepID=UPI0009E1FD7B|nr:protein trichome birefringence-like 3 [Phalaenopsis equestris]
MKIPMGKLPLSIMAIIICTLALTILIFAEDLTSITGFQLKSCSRKLTITNSKVMEKENTTEEDDDFIDEDKINFDPNECRIEKGRWIFNGSAEPFYTDKSCPYLDNQVTCLKNGRQDSEYLQWEWQPDDCILPRFNAADLLQKLREKRLMFVGDSLQRQQWQSLVCMVESVLPSDKKSMKLDQSLSVFKAEDYNATIEFYWAPFLVQSNSDETIIAESKERILRVDSIHKHAQNWVGVDILVFNSYVWWMNGHRMKALWGSFENGEEGYEELEAVVVYRMAIKTWANWIDSSLNKSSTRIFFGTASPTHMKSADWNQENGTHCHDERRPVMRPGYWGSGADKRMMEVVSGIVGRMKVPVTFINITQLSQYRKDGHVSVYTEPQAGNITAEEQVVSDRYVDCIHWCLPGVPDTWNQILYAYL